MREHNHILFHRVAKFMPSTPDVHEISRLARFIRGSLGLMLGLGIVAGAGWWGWRAYRVSALEQEASIAAKVGSWSKAQEAVDKIDWYGASSEEIVRIRSLASLARRDRLAAARFLGMMPENARDAGQSYEKQGFLLRDLYFLDEAEAAFRRAIKVDPSLLEARRALVALLGLERRGPEQEMELWALLERTPHPVEALRVLAQAGPAIPPDGLPPGLDEGQALERVLRAEPTNDHARAALAGYYRGRGDFAGAKRLLSEAPAKTSVIELESQALAIDNGDLEAGELYFDKSGVPVPSNDLPRFLRLQGDWWEAKGDLSRALEAYLNALKADPRSVELNYRTGRVLAALKRPKEADQYVTYAEKTRMLKTLVARLPDDNPDPRLCAEAAALCRAMRREDEAKAWDKLAERSNSTR